MTTRIGSCAATLVFLVTGAVSGCDRAATTESRAGHIAAVTRTGNAPAAPSAGPRHPSVPDETQQRAIGALLIHLIDEEPPLLRWRDPQLPIVCGEGTSVRVNGQPVVEGDEVPVTSFTLDWQLAVACPLGANGPILSGPLQMIVVRDDEFGLVPLVRPARDH